MLSNNIRADIELTITYKIKDSYYCVSTEDMGGGNYISIRGINDDDMDKTCYCSNCNEHFPEDWLYPGWEHGSTKFKQIKYCPYCGAEFENKY